MLFISGTKDKLFPIEGSNKAFSIMHKVWDSQGAVNNLQTEMWDIPHTFGKHAQKRTLEFFREHL